MELLVTIFWVCHLIATASIVLGWVVSLFRSGFGVTVMAWAARSQLLIGLILMNLTFAHGMNFPKIILKIMLAVVVVGLVEMANVRLKKSQSASVLAAVAVALTAVIATISFLWH
ncbi:MAG: hypothetical protein LWW77_09140 [Propionibacteriales bacterium]|nr:hypothetical protein [Propionibacteriales bacterium]